MCLELAAESPLLSGYWAKSLRVNVLHVNTHHAQDFHPVRPVKKDILLQCLLSVVLGELPAVYQRQQQFAPLRPLLIGLIGKYSASPFWDLKKTKNVHKWTLKSLLGSSKNALNTWCWYCQNIVIFSDGKLGACIGSSWWDHFMHRVSLEWLIRSIITAQ